MPAVEGTTGTADVTTTSMDGQTSTGNMDINDFLWAGLGSNPQEITFYSTMGLVLASLVISSTWTLAIRYFELFSKTDHITIRVGICLGTVLATCCLALNCAQTYELTQHAATNYASIAPFDIYANLALDAMVGVFAYSASLFYTWRVFKLSGRNKFLGGYLVVVSTAGFAVVFVILAKGIPMPEISLQNTSALVKYVEDLTKYQKVVAAVGMVADGSICICMIVALYRSRQSLFNLEKRLTTRLTSLVFETMLPPAVVVLILCCAATATGSALADWRRMLFYVMPLLYFHSLLYSLVSRQDIRRILDQKLHSDGITMVPTSSFERRNGSVNVVYVSTTRDVHATKSEEEFKPKFTNRTPLPTDFNRLPSTEDAKTLYE